MDEDTEPSEGWSEARKRVLQLSYYLEWIDKPPLESRDRTLYRLEQMSKQSITELLLIAQDPTADAWSRLTLLTTVDRMADYLTKLDLMVVGLRTKMRTIMDAIPFSEEDDKEIEQELQKYRAKKRKKG